MERLGLTAPDAALHELFIADVGVGCDAAIALEASLFVILWSSEKGGFFLVALPKIIQSWPLFTAKPRIRR